MYASANNRAPGLYAGSRNDRLKRSQVLDNPASGRLLLLGASAVILLAVLLLREPVKRAARISPRTPPGFQAPAPQGQTPSQFNLASKWPQLPQSDKDILSKIQAGQIWDLPSLNKMNPDTASVKTARSIANTAEQFVRLVKESAIRSAKKNGYPDAKMIVTQAALESGWGKKAIGGTNLFGHVATPEWSAKNKYSLEKTSEYKNGQKVIVYRPFRVYDSLEQAFDHHHKVLDKFPGAKKAKTAREFGNALVIKDSKGKITRYATAPDYSDLIDSIYKTVSRLWL